MSSFLFKHKSIIIAVAAALVVAVILSVVFKPNKSQSEDESIDPHGVTESDITITVPNIKPGDDSGNNAKTTDSPNGVDLDVRGNPNNSGGNSDGNSADLGVGNPNGNSTQPPPSVNVDVATVEFVPKDVQPNPQPPPDEYVVILEKFEDIPVSADKSIKKPQPEIGFIVGANLENAGYNTLFTNAGTPRQMVVEAVKNYADTGRVSLKPADYGLPALVGEYHVKLPVKGTNVKESAKYISDYMRNDRAFNNKVNTVFSQYKDGFLAVYQKDGHFYVLFAVIDKGYVN